MSDRTAHILVADDDPSIRELLCLRLERDGYRVTLVEDGRVAVRAIAEQLPDLLIVDMMMPRLDGIGVIKRVRENPATAALPILMLTGRDRGVDKTFGLEAGADDYLGKPFEFPELLARVAALLRRSRAEWQATAVAATRGQVIAFVGAKGGVGTTTVAVNAGVALARSGTPTILADLRPFRGTMAALLGLTPRRGIDRLPLARPEVMTVAMVDDTLLAHSGGLRLLLGPTGEHDQPPEAGVAAAIEGLRQLATIVLADIDGPFDPFGRAVLAVAEQVWVVTEPEALAVGQAEAMVALLEQRGVRPGRIGLIANQTGPEMKLGVAAIAARVGRPVSYALPAAGAPCVEAAATGVPLIGLAPDLPAAVRLVALAGDIAAGRAPGTAPKAPPAAAVDPPPEPEADGTSARAALRQAVARHHEG